MAVHLAGTDVILRTLLMGWRDGSEMCGPGFHPWSSFYDTLSITRCTILQPSPTSLKENSCRDLKILSSRISALLTFSMCSLYTFIWHRHFSQGRLWFLGFSSDCFVLWIYLLQYLKLWTVCYWVQANSSLFWPNTPSSRGVSKNTHWAGDLEL